MLTEKILKAAAQMIAAQEREIGHYFSLNEMHDALGLNWAAHQHEIVKSLTRGHGVGSFHMHLARTGEAC